MSFVNSRRCAAGHVGGQMCGLRLQSASAVTQWTCTSLHALLPCPEVVSVAIAAAEFELRTLACGWIVPPPRQQGPAVSPHGWQIAHVL